MGDCEPGIGMEPSIGTNADVTSVGHFWNINFY